MIKDVIIKDKLMESERFLINPKEFTISSLTKISINKFELLKAVTLSAKSGEAGYALIVPSHDKVNRKFENKVVNDMNKWIRDREQNLKGELKRFYEDLDY